MTTVGDEACRARAHHRLGGVRSALLADVARFLAETGGGAAAGRVGRLTALSALATPPVLGVAMYRLGHLAWVRGWRRTARALARLNHALHKVHISPESCVGEGLWLPHPCGVVFHGRAGRGLGLYADCLCAPERPGRPLDEGPVLGDNVLVGIHVAVLGPVRVGDRTNLPFKVTLRSDAPPDSVASARTLRPR